MRVLVDQKCKVYRYDFVRVEYYVMAMSLWVTLYGLLCHCGTPCISGYVIVGHPIWVAMSLWDTLYRWLCYCGTPYIGGFVIVGHPMWVAMSL